MCRAAVVPLLLLLDQEESCPEDVSKVHQSSVLGPFLRYSKENLQSNVFKLFSLYLEKVNKHGDRRMHVYIHYHLVMS